jgi:hypothetical protein
MEPRGLSLLLKLAAQRWPHEGPCRCACRRRLQRSRLSGNDRGGTRRRRRSGCLRRWSRTEHRTVNLSVGCVGARSTTPGREQRQPADQGTPQARRRNRWCDPWHDSPRYGSSCRLATSGEGGSSDEGGFLRPSRRFRVAPRLRAVTPLARGLESLPGEAWRLLAPTSLSTAKTFAANTPFVVAGTNSRRPRPCAGQHWCTRAAMEQPLISWSCSAPCANQDQPETFHLV